MKIYGTQTLINQKLNQEEIKSRSDKHLFTIVVKIMFSQNIIQLYKLNFFCSKL